MASIITSLESVNVEQHNMVEERLLLSSWDASEYVKQGDNILKTKDPKGRKQFLDNNNVMYNYATVQIVISSDLFIKQVIFGSNRWNIWASGLLGSPRCNTASYTKHPMPVYKITFSESSRDMIMSMESLQLRLCIFHYQFSSII